MKKNRIGELLSRFHHMGVDSVCRQRKWDKMARCLRDTWGRCWSG